MFFLPPCFPPTLQLPPPKVWRDEGEHERVRAREEAERQEAAEAFRRNREEFHQQSLRERAEKQGAVKATEATVVEVSAVVAV